MKLSNILIGILIISLLLSPITGAFDIKSEGQNEFIDYNVECEGIPGEKLVKVDLEYSSFANSDIIKGLPLDTQITFSDFDESHPTIDIDGNGNPFLMYHMEEDLFTSYLFMQRSVDLGESWPEDLIWFYEFGDVTPINPEFDFVDGVRAYATFEVAEQEPILYFFDLIEIGDPGSWDLWSFDRSNSANYVAETAITANQSGRIAMASLQDYEGDDYFQDTILITWDANNFDDQTADGGVYWLNNDNDGNSIPYSHLSADAGDKVWFVFERSPYGSPSQIATALCKIDENTLYSDWRQQSVSANNRFNSSYPDISVSGKKAFVAYMYDQNGNQDIYVASSVTGSFWNKYQVTDSPDDDMYPVISADGDDVSILFMRNGDIYVTTSEDAGKTWNTPEKVNDGSNTVEEIFQNSALKGNYGFWTDNRNGNTDIYFESVGSSPNVIIDTISGGIGVNAIIKNTGSGDAIDIPYTFSASGGILGFINSEDSGTISIPSGGEATVSLPMLFGIGAITISLSVGSAFSQVEGTQILIYTSL